MARSLTKQLLFIVDKEHCVWQFQWRRARVWEFTCTLIRSRFAEAIVNILFCPFSSFMYCISSWLAASTPTKWGCTIKRWLWEGREKGIRKCAHDDLRIFRLAPRLEIAHHCRNFRFVHNEKTFDKRLTLNLPKRELIYAIERGLPADKKNLHRFATRCRAVANYRDKSSFLI